MSEKSTFQILMDRIGLSQSINNLISNTQSGIDSITEVYDVLYNLNINNSSQISQLEAQIIGLSSSYSVGINGTSGVNGSNGTSGTSGMSGTSGTSASNNHRLQDWQDPYLYLGYAATGTSMSSPNWTITRSEVYPNGDTNDIVLFGVAWTNRSILNW